MFKPFPNKSVVVLSQDLHPAVAKIARIYECPSSPNLGFRRFNPFPSSVILVIWWHNFLCCWCPPSYKLVPQPHEIQINGYMISDISWYINKKKRIIHFFIMAHLTFGVSQWVCPVGSRLKDRAAAATGTCWVYGGYHQLVHRVILNKLITCGPTIRICFCFICFRVFLKQKNIFQTTDQSLFCGNP